MITLSGTGGVVAKGPEKPVIKIDKYENLLLEIEGDDVKVAAGLNGDRWGGKALNAVTALPAFVHGARPGPNGMVVGFSEIGPGAKARVGFYRQIGFDHATRTTLVEWTFEKADIPAGENPIVSLEFTLDCPGAWPGLAKERDAALARITAKYAKFKMPPENREEMARMDILQTREDAAKAPSEDEARKIFDAAGR